MIDDSTKAFLKDMGLIRHSTMQEEICHLEMQKEQVEEEMDEGKGFYLQVAKKGLVMELFFSDEKLWKECIDYLEEQKKMVAKK